MTTSPDRTAGYKLIETGTLVVFEVIDTKVQETADGEDSIVQIDLHLGEVETFEDGAEERTTDHEWGAFGFIFCLAVLSFADARPRGVSGMHYEEHDEFTVVDLFECLRYERGELRFAADYVRGRCLKTDIWVRPDGTARLETRKRGEAATRWVQRLKGKKVLEVVR